jgi:hypothetical protein
MGETSCASGSTRSTARVNTHTMLLAYADERRISSVARPAIMQTAAALMEMSSTSPRILAQGAPASQPLTSAPMV